MATAKKTAAQPVAAKTKKAEGTPLTPKFKKKLLEQTQLDCETEEEARAAMVAILAKSDINNVDGDSLDDLLDMVSAFPAGEGEAEEEPVAPAPKKKATKPAPPVEEEEEAVDEEEVVEEELVEEEEEAPAPVKKGKKVVATKKVATAAEEEEETEELIKEVKAKGLSPISSKKVAAPKVAKKGSNRVHKLLGNKWGELAEADKLKAIKPLRKFLPEKEFRIDFLQQSIICKYLGETNEHNIFKYHLLRLLPDGKLEGIFVSHRFKTPAEFAAYLPPVEDREGLKLNQGESCSYIHPFHLDRVIELFDETDFIKDSVAAAKTADGRMASNHKKLQAQMEGKKSAAPATKKVVAPVKGKKLPDPVEEEEEAVEEEEAPTPPKKVAAKTAPVKAAAVPAKGKKAAPLVEEEEAEEEEEAPAPAKKVVTKVAPGKVATPVKKVVAAATVPDKKK